MKHLQQLKKENSSHIKEEPLEDSKKVLDDDKEKIVQKFKEEIHNGMQQEIKEEEGVDRACREEVDNTLKLLKGTVKSETTIKNSSAKAKSKPVKKLKNKASPLVGEISPFRRKKLKT